MVVLLSFSAFFSGSETALFSLSPGQLFRLRRGGRGGQMVGSLMARPAQIEVDLKLLESFRPAPEKFTEQVTVYPMAGATAGSAGLLLTPPTMSIVIAGDAVLTAGHVALGQVWEGCDDREKALDTLRDVLELADVIVPGHDNVCISPGRWV